MGWTLCAWKKQSKVFQEKHRQIFQYLEFFPWMGNKSPSKNSWCAFYIINDASEISVTNHSSLIFIKICQFSLMMSHEQWIGCVRFITIVTQITVKIVDEPTITCTPIDLNDNSNWKTFELKKSKSHETPLNIWSKW